MIRDVAMAEAAILALGIGAVAVLEFTAWRRRRRNLKNSGSTEAPSPQQR